MMITQGKWIVKEIETTNGSYFKIVSENSSYAQGESVCNITTRNSARARANADKIVELINNL